MGADLPRAAAGTDGPRPRVAVVGGGFGGAIFATHLIRAARGPLDIFIVEPRPVLGHGLAYGTDDPEHRINVPSDKMFVFEEDQTHFTRWLDRSGARAADPEGDAPKLAPESEGAGRWHYSRRRDFGAYVAATLEEEAAVAAPRGVRLRHLRTRTVDLLPSDDGVGATLALESGGDLTVDHVILAASFETPRAPWALSPWTRAFPRLFLDPWSPGLARALRPEHRLAILGAGLTMTDVAVGALKTRADGGAPITAISRSAMLPIPHTRFVPGEPALGVASPPRTALGLLRLARASVRRSERDGGDWRIGIDSLRREAERLWRALPSREQAKAARRLRRFWDVRRYRMAPQLAAVMETAQESGALRVEAGRILSIERTPESAASDHLVIRYRSAETGRETRLEADALVNCIGPSSDIGETDNPVIRALLDHGRAAADPHRLGLQVDESCRLVDGQGCVQPALRAIGPLTRGVFWEVVGVPELSAQARRVAESLACDLSEAAPADPEAAPRAAVL